MFLATTTSIQAGSPHPPASCEALYAQPLWNQLTPEQLSKGKKAIMDALTNPNLFSYKKVKIFQDSQKVLEQDPEFFAQFLLEFPKPIITGPDLDSLGEKFLEKLLTQNPVSVSGAIPQARAETILERVFQQIQDSDGIFDTNFTNNLRPLRALWLSNMVRMTFPSLSPSRRSDLFNKMIRLKGLENSHRWTRSLDVQAEEWFARLRHEAGLNSPVKIRLYEQQVNSFTFRSSHPFSDAVDMGTHWERTIKIPAQKKTPFVMEGPEGHVVQFTSKNSDLFKRPSRAEPAYKEMGSDGVIRGLYWADSGFNRSEATELMREYIANFKEKGFKFKSHSLQNFQELLTQNVKDGHLDYMLREGHNPPDSPSVAAAGILHRGTREGSPLQEVLIFEPTSTKTQSLDWNALGSSLQERSTKLPFYYIDTKCNAYSSMCDVLENVRSEKLNIISPTGSATTFVNDDTSPLRALVNGFVDNKTYAQIRKDIENARAATRREAKAINNYDPEDIDDLELEDAYVFEDDPEYTRHIKNLQKQIANETVVGVIAPDGSVQILRPN